jgi:hypothetical protein
MLVLRRLFKPNIAEIGADLKGPKLVVGGGGFLTKIQKTQ